MSRVRGPGASQSAAAKCAVILLAAGLLAASIKWRAATFFDASSPTVRLSSASIHSTVEDRRSQGSQPNPIIVDVDATRSGVENTSLLQTISEDLAAGGSASESGTVSMHASRERGRSSFVTWARLDTLPATISWGTLVPSGDISIYAVHSRDGAAVCVRNLGPNDIVLSLRLRLAPAPYKIERLKLPVRRPSETAVLSSSLTPSALSGTSNREASVENLRGRDLAKTGRTTIPMTVRSKGITLIRFTDAAFVSRCALNEVRDRLKLLPKSSAELSRRLHVILDGAAGCDKALTSFYGLPADVRRASVHRFLLVLGQVDALLRNFRGQSGSQPDRATELHDAVLRLNESLADVSATLLGLVPAIVLSNKSPEQSAHGDQPGFGADGPASEARHTMFATVGLVNQGEHSAELVKIGIDRNRLPDGVECEPADPAFFGSLKPNQTAKSTYVLHWQGASAPDLAGIVGDISYFASGAPAHLYPRTW